MYTTYLIILMLSAAFFTAAGTAALWWWLSRAQLVDTPNERSNHETPVPKGAGMAMMAVLLAFLGVGGMDGDLLFGLAALTAISFLDDLREVEPKWRLLVQVGVVALGVFAIDGAVFQGLLPLWLDKLIVVFIWLWFLNLYNFMDGIDGITSANTISLCVALIVLYYSATALHRGVYIDAAIIGAAVLAFAPFNWHPAKLFMGDAGSVPLGFLMGFLLLQVAADGYWMAALILPAFYLADATVTLVKRLLRKEKIWIAHSQHYYQLAVRAGLPHNEVAKHIIALNSILAVLAVCSVHFHWAVGLGCLVAAYICAFLLMLTLSGRITLSFLPHASPRAQ